MKFFNPCAEIHKTRNHLLQWEQPGVPCFVAFRMADFNPQELLRELDKERRQWTARHPPPLSAEDEAEYQGVFSTRIDQWMDEGHGSCVLRDPMLRQSIASSFHFGQGERYDLLAWVIMPNHVHVLFMLHLAWKLEEVLQGWKLYTARQIQQSLGRSGQFWQHDYFDRLIRDGDHLRNVIRYILRSSSSRQRIQPLGKRPHENRLTQGVAFSKCLLMTRHLESATT